MGLCTITIISFYCFHELCTKCIFFLLFPFGKLYQKGKLLFPFKIVIVLLRTVYFLRILFHFFSRLLPFVCSFAHMNAYVFLNLPTSMHIFLHKTTTSTRYPLLCARQYEATQKIFHLFLNHFNFTKSILILYANYLLQHCAYFRPIHLNFLHHLNDKILI